MNGPARAGVGGPVAVLVAALVLVVAAGSRAASGDAGTIVTAAGTGLQGHSGDGGPAIGAAIDHPRGLAVLRGGGFLVVEPFANTVRRVWPDGTITTVAGTGAAGFAGDGGPAKLAEFNLVHDVEVLTDGSFVLADAGNNRVRRISANGVIMTVAGTGVHGFSGDGGPTGSAAIANPRGLAALPDGGYLIADTDNHRVRRVWPDGRITTVAGSGTAGSSGDGGLATAAALELPFGVSPTSDGGFLIADALAARVRRVWPGGTITTVAGTGVSGFSGDDGPATAAELRSPHAVAVLPDGGFLVADALDSRVRRVWPDGTITTVAGTGVSGFSGDGGPAREAELNQPKALAILSDGSGFLVGDSANNRVRRVRVNLRPALVLHAVTAHLRTRVGRATVIRYTLSEKAVVQLFAYRRGTLEVRLVSRGAEGANRLAFGRSLRPGSYALKLVAATSDGRSARETVSLRILP